MNHMKTKYHEDFSKETVIIGIHVQQYQLVQIYAYSIITG